MKLQPLADTATQGMRDTGNVNASWEQVRDYCDTLTGSELDCTQLDILSDMTLQRLRGGK